MLLSTKSVFRKSDESLLVFEKTSLNFAMRSTIHFGQYFSVFPLYENEEKWMFVWFSPKMVYCLFIIVLQTVYTVLVGIYSIRDTSNFFGFVVVVWNLRALAVLLCFLKIAKKWPQLMNFWDQLDRSMEHFKFQFDLSKRIKITGFIAAATTIFEHCLFIASGIKMVKSKTTDEPVKLYFMLLFQEVFAVTEFTYLKAALVEVLSIISTFLRIYSDFFTMILSSALALRLHQIVNRTKHANVLHDDFFRRMQVTYSNLSILTKEVNGMLAEMISIIFASNIYFLSVTLVQILSPRNGALSIFYYFYNLFYQVFHLAAMCIYCSWPHEENDKLIEIIFNIPSSKYTAETERFFEQVYYENIAMTAGGMLHFKRNCFLKAITVIVTLQLLFVEFDSNIVGNIE